MNIPTVSDVIAAFFASSHPAGDPGVCVDARGRIAAEAALDAADPEPEAEP